MTTLGAAWEFSTSSRDRCSWNAGVIHVRWLLWMPDQLYEPSRALQLHAHSCVSIKVKQFPDLLRDTLGLVIASEQTQNTS